MVDTTVTRQRVHGVLTALVVAIAVLVAVPGPAVADGSPTGPIAGTDFLTPGQTEPVPTGLASPVPKSPRVYDSTTGFWGATFAQVGVHDHAVVSPTVAVGAGRVYVASSYQRAVFMYDADTLAPVAVNGGVFGTSGPGQLDNPQGIAVYRNEVFVSDPGDTDYAHGPGRIMVYDTDGNFKRSFDGKIQGLDVAWGEIWGRAAESAIDPLLLGQRWPLRMEARDTQTGLLRAVVPFNENCGIYDWSSPVCFPYLHYGRDHDVAVAPDVGAVFNGWSIIERNPMYPALSIGYGSMQVNASDYCTFGEWPTTYGEPMGATTVWGAKTLMTADNCAGNDSVGGWKFGTIHQMGLRNDPNTGLVGSSYGDEEWYTQDRSDVARDVAFRVTKAHIVWMGGNLPDQASWMAGTQCVRYIITDGDWYIVGNRGEHWYKIATGMTGSVGLTLNGTQVTYAPGSTDPTQPIGTLCFDTAHPFGSGSNIASGIYNLTMTATVSGSQITRTNPTLHLDHDPPTGNLNGLPAATNAPISATGTISDSHSGAATWNLQINGPGTGGQFQAVCSAAAPSSGSTWGCTWNTPAYPEGTYQVRALLADRVQPSYGGPNTAGVNTQTVIVDRTPPDLRDPAPALGSDFASQIDRDVVRVWMIQTDGGSGMRETTLEYNSAPDGTANGSWSAANAAPATNSNPEYPDEGYTTWNTSSIPDGVHRIRAATCDRANNCAQNQWQVVMSARRRTCPGTSGGPRCYAGQAFGDYEDGVGPLGGFGLRGIIQAPKKAPPYGSGFSGDHVAVIGSAANTDEIGISNNFCQDDSGMAWYAYAYIIDGTFGNDDPCFARIPAGQARKFQVVIAAGRAYVAMSATPTGPYQTRAVSGVRRSTWVGRGRADLPGEAETDRYGRYIGGWFIGMRYRSRNGTWRGPVRLSRQDQGQGYRSEYASDISNYCVHGPGASCTPKTSP